MGASRTRRECIAVHEATHAVVALKLGLPVSWVSIEHGYEEGITYSAAVKMPDDQIDMERDRFAICVAMAAPSFLNTYDEGVDDYARREASLAYWIAAKHAIDPEHVYDDAASLVSDHHVEIYDLADRLEEEGKVMMEMAS
jgi:hypothetical protein